MLHTFLFALLKSTSSLGKTTRLENFYKRNQNGVSYHHNSVFLEVAFTFKLLIEGYFSAIYKMWLESIVSILSGSYYRLSNFFCWKCSQSSEPYNYAVRIESKSREQSQQTYLSVKPNEEKSVLFLIPFHLAFFRRISSCHKFNSNVRYTAVFKD